MRDLFQTRCGSCGERVSPLARYCGNCRETPRSTKVWEKCGRCGADVGAEKKFCHFCGASLDAYKKPDVIENEWVRKEGEFAAKVEAADVKGFLAKTLYVAPGTRAVFVLDGKMGGEVGPGTYAMGGLLARITGLASAKRITAILLNAWDTILDYEIQGLYTKDPIEIGVGCSLLVRVDDPARFALNVMKEKAVVEGGKIRSLLFDEVKAGLSAAVAGISVRDLAENLAVKTKIEKALEANLGESCARFGLGFEGVKTIEYFHEYDEKVTGKRARAFLRVSEAEADLEEKKLLFDVMNAGEIEDLRQETARVVNYEKRVDVLDRMQKAVHRKTASEITNDKDLHLLRNEVDRERFLSDAEFERFASVVREHEEDRQAARDHLLKKLDLERTLERRRIELIGEQKLDHELDDGEVEHRIAKDRKELDAKLAAGAKSFAHELKLAQERWGEEKKKRIDEIDLDKKEAEAGIELLRKMKAAKAEAKEREVEIDLKAKRGEAEIEKERLRALSEASIETLISVSDAEQAKMLADLKKTESLKGMTEEQILALAADGNPEVARAFQEKFKSLGSSQIEKFYERMLAEQKEQATGFQKTTQEMFDKALEMQRDVAVGTSRPPVGPNVVYPPAGGGAAIVGGAAAGPPAQAAEMVCPGCRASVPKESRFCENCGHEF